MRKLFLLLFAGILVNASAGFAQDSTYYFRGATLLPISGPPIENGLVIVKNGRIQAVRADDGAAAPAEAKVFDLRGKILMPGLVDTHSHLGEGDGGDRSAALNPEVRILDAVDPRSDGFKRALAGGLTTLNVMPGSGHLMSGQTVYLKLRTNATTIEDLLFCDDATNGICGGMKMANGTNSIKGKPFPGTRAKSAAMVRQLFVEAQAYRKKIQAAGTDPNKRPERDLRLEPLVQILDGNRIVHFHTHRHDDILTAMRLAEEFGFKVVLHHVSEGWKVAKEIADAKVPCSIIVIDAPGGKMEAVDLIPETGGILEKAGADVAFHTDDPITDSRRFFRSAAVAVREGMSREKALEGLTLAGARMLGLEDRIGSLEAGKDADFIVLSGDPMSVYTRVEQTWVEGRKVFDLAYPKDKAYAAGGYGVYHFRSRMHHHD